MNLKAGSSSSGVRRIPVVVTSRMTSERLPGKALQEIAGRPLLGWVVEAVKMSVHASAVVIATSKEPSDAAIRQWCQNESVKCVTGPLQDVLRRIEQAAVELSCDAVVRVSGDSPLLDPLLIDFALQLFDAQECDLVTNVQTRTFPRGQSVEVIRSELVRELAASNLSAIHREHVTSAVYERLVTARVVDFTASQVAPVYVESMTRRGICLERVNLSVDTPEDLSHAQEVVEALQPISPAQAGWVRTTEASLAISLGTP